jgi:hypothetical protein
MSDALRWCRKIRILTNFQCSRMFDVCSRTSDVLRYAVGKSETPTNGAQRQVTCHKSTKSDFGYSSDPFIISQATYYHQRKYYTTMILAKNIVLAFIGASLVARQTNAECSSLESITCVPTSTAPTLDGDVSDWSSIESFESSLVGAMTGSEYPHGNLKVQCVYDAEKVYFLFEVPGPYRFDTEDNHLCAAMSTMMKMGPDAQLCECGN